jgi:hypothetical protein
MRDGFPAQAKAQDRRPRIAPLVPMPMVQPLSDADWQPFLELLPSRSRSEILRDELNELLVTYLGYLDGEARSPPTREVAAVLQELARRAYQFAHDLLRLDGLAPTAQTLMTLQRTNRFR